MNSMKTLINYNNEFFSKKIQTENRAISNETSLNHNLDYFSKMIRDIDETDSITFFRNAYNENKLLALKNLFHVRDIRGGSGEKKIFRNQMKWLIVHHPKVALHNMKHIPNYGRWDDIIICFMGTRFEKNLLDFISSQLEIDIINMKQQKSVTLLAKWFPSENSSLDRSVNGIFRKVAKKLDLSYKSLRQIYITPLRSYIEIVEAKMCSNQWSEINLERVPSQAMKHFKNVFEEKCPQWDKYVEDLKNNKAKINTSTLDPHQIVGEYLKNLPNSYYEYNCKIVTKLNPILEEQWKSIVDNVKKMGSLGKSIVMVDTSGSMFGDNAIKVSLALGLIISECTNDAFKNFIITFESKSHFIKIPNDNLLSSLRFLIDNRKFPWGGSTNFQFAFDSILKQANEYVYSDKTIGLKPEDMPDKLFVISDMQFNETSHQFSTNYELIKRKYNKFGYQIPQIIFWNVRANSSDFPVTINDTNTALISGFSTSILKSVLEGADITPLGVMLRTLDDERYNLVSLPKI